MMISLFGSKVGCEEMQEIQSSIEQQWLGIGKKCADFESMMAKRLRINDFVMVNSGSNALLLAVKLFNLPQGSEVILPSYTWVSCAHAIVLNGLKPVFCDVDLDTCNISRKHIEPLITSKTKAIMIVHYAGKPVGMQDIMDLGFPVIEDAAHAVDSKINEKYCGTIGDIGIYSFDAVKNLTTADGGGVVSRRDDFVKYARSIRYCGIAKSGFDTSKNTGRWWEHNIVDFFPKVIPNDICASIGIGQLKKLDEFQDYRKRIWEKYDKAFSKVSWLNIPKGPDKNEQHSYFTYFIRLNNDKRDALARYLYAQGIYTSVRYHPLHLNKIYKTDTCLRNCEKLNETALNIPLHPNLSAADVEKVISEIKNFGKQYC
ncbi:MAG: DegT/DnrJ/EryC1/StrS family aminotransferase [Candidatus Omnitrophica bacterium]|nr:DegT/DnrJ/EryC1/StrS family aminotransferase [Candidatus Omnitrophota bacterium]